MTDIKQVGGDHYQRFNPQIIDFIMDNRVPYCMGCFLKYVSRAPYKNGAEDIAKARSLIPAIMREQHWITGFRDDAVNRWLDANKGNLTRAAQEAWRAVWKGSAKNLEIICDALEQENS